MLQTPYNVAGAVKCYPACSSQTAAGVPILTVAAATEDNVKVTGKTIDRKGTSVGSLAQSCEISTHYRATLANTKTLKFALEYQTSADNSSWDTAVVIQAATTAATGDGVSTEFEGVVLHTLDLSTLKRYVRINVTPDLSNTATDAALWSTQVVLGGFAHSADC